MVGLVTTGLTSAMHFYGGYRSPETNLHPTVYSRNTVWTLGEFAVMLGGLAVRPRRLHRPPAVRRAPRHGARQRRRVGIGPNEARALSRALEAEQHGDDLRQERGLRERIVENSGTGIGLARCERIVDRQVGEIRMESSASQGSTVHFTGPHPASDLDRSEQRARSRENSLE